MTSDTELLKKRFLELARKSAGSDVFTFTDFLGLAEQSAFSEIKRELRGVHYEAFATLCHSLSRLSRQSR